MELKRITEERLQTLAFLPESEWTAEERSLVDSTPAYREEVEAYRNLFQELEMVEAPEFAAGFEDRILDRLPEPVTQSPTVWKRVPGWLQWTGVGSLVAGTAAATLLFYPAPSSTPTLPSVDISSAQTSFQYISGLFESNGLLIAAGCIAILGTALLDKYLRKRPSTRFSL